jgi:putative phosphoesterase
MLIGLIADTHDRVPAIAALVAQLAEQRVELLLHAGDYCSPFALAPLHELRVPIVGVFGRNDGDRDGLTAAASAGLETELHEAPHSLKVGERRILLLHDVSDVPAQSLESHDIVVHGCQHRPEMKERGNTLLVCPGEGCGWIHGSPGAALLDLSTKRVEFLKLSGPEWKT